MADDIKMSDEVAAGVKDSFNNLSNEFDHQKVFMSQESGFISSACGEFAASVADGGHTFDLGWRDVLEIGRVSAGLIAGNTNTFKVDLDAVDQDYSWLPSL